jgi:hypothetical protein
MTDTTPFPHGMPAGHDRGCKTKSGCPNQGTELPTCVEAWVRYNGDYSYRKAVDAGTVSVPIAPLIDRPEPRRVFSDSQNGTPTKRRRAPDGVIIHGTASGYKRGCKKASECPNFRTDHETCADARARYQRENRYKRLADAAAAAGQPAPPRRVKGNAHGPLAKPPKPPAAITQLRALTTDTEPFLLALVQFVGFGGTPEQLAAVTERLASGGTP